MAVSENEFERAFNALREDMKAGFGGVNARLDQLNGRTGRNETAIAILQDRQQRTAAAWGALSGGALAGALSLIKYWFGK